MPPAINDRLDAVRNTLDSVNQSHVLRFFDELNESQQDQLLAQIEGIDWPEVARLVDSYVMTKPEFKLPTQIDPAPVYPRTPTADLEAKYAEARQVGEQLIRDGKVAAFTVAGGQGTRLGFDAPKGMFPATPIRGLPLFHVFAEYILKAQKKWDTIIPWYIMTSPVNDAATREFFDDNECFGIEDENIHFFPQAMMPALDMDTGKVLLAAKDSLALSPNGHGGSLKALWTSGAIDDMKKRGVTQISYTQVDNPQVKMVDPLFIGLHALDQAQMSSKMLPKAFPKEKMGNFCLVDGRVTIIEYSDLPDELTEQRLPNGDLKFGAGSIAIHVIARDFVESLNTTGDGFGLPFHRAEKKVACINIENGNPIEPTEPNAVKLETFVFDALPLCESSIVYETDRIEEFAPIKNADAPKGEPIAVDSPASSKRLQVERAGRWLEEVGVIVTRDDDGHVEGTVEVAQSTAIEASDLIGQGLPDAIGPGSRLVI